MGRRHLQTRFALAIPADGGHNLGSLLVGLHHRWDQIRRMLQVGIHQDRRITTTIGIVEPGQHGGFLAKVARQTDQAQFATGPGCLTLVVGNQLADDGGAVVFGAVIHQDQPLDTGLGTYRFNECANARRFVEAGGHHPNPGGVGRGNSGAVDVWGHG